MNHSPAVSSPTRCNLAGANDSETRRLSPRERREEPREALASERSHAHRSDALDARCNSASHRSDLGAQIQESRFEPSDEVGWAWRLLLSLPLAAFLILTLGGLAWAAFSLSRVRALGTLCIAFAMPVLAYQAIGYINVALRSSARCSHERHLCPIHPSAEGWRSD